MLHHLANPSFSRGEQNKMTDLRIIILLLESNTNLEGVKGNKLMNESTLQEEYLQCIDTPVVLQNYIDSGTRVINITECELKKHKVE